MVFIWASLYSTPYVIWSTDRYDLWSIHRLLLFWEQDSQMLLNLYCNQKMNFNDGTCCAKAEKSSFSQKIIFVLYAIWYWVHHYQTTKYWSLINFLLKYIALCLSLRLRKAVEELAHASRNQRYIVCICCSTAWWTGQLTEKNEYLQGSEIRLNSINDSGSKNLIFNMSKFALIMFYFYATDR